MQRIALSALSFCSLLICGCDETEYIKNTIGKPAPDFELTAMDGGKVKLSNYRGKPVLLTFWAYG